MRQRVLIAMAIACHPAVLIADEPTTALDATVQAQILELLSSLSRQLHMATILITHNLGIVAGLCDRVAVMYAGRIVEMAPRDELFTATRHPYTVGLLRCVPRLDRLGPGWIQSIPGQPPDLSQLPPGCSFAPRCPLAGEQCLRELPLLRSHGPGHSAACWNAEQIGELLASPNGWASDRLQVEVHPVQTPEPEQSRTGQARPLVEVRDLTVHFPVRDQGWFSRKRLAVHAVDGISFDIAPGETLGLVGESGCGKSTTGRALVWLYRPTGGQVLFDGHDLAQLRPDVLRSMRRRFQIVLQDPFSALNPRMTAGALVGEALAIHRIGTRRDRGARVAELLELVGLRPEWAARYPHQFSGGQKQRIAIARALASNPEFIVLDEPVSALDVSIQSQILRLLADLQQRLGLTYLLIAHDLAVVGQMCQRVAVMYLGKIVEIAERDRLYRLPLHPYTRALFSAVPVPDPAVERTRRRIILQGDVPSPIVPPAGCRFHTRCPIAVERCRIEEPPLRELAPGQRVACHLAEQMAALPPQSALTPGGGLSYSPPGSS
jgi:peptide/nickel transport system ATP-binding protein